MSTNILVKKLMQKNVKTIQIPGSRDELLEAIRTHHYSVFPVIDSSNQYKGIVGRRELMRKPVETQLSLLMSKEVPTGKEKEKIVDIARKIIENKISKLPILDNKNQVIGIISISDIIWKFIVQLNIDLKVEDYYSEEITSVWEGTPSNVCVPILKHSGQESLPVINDKNGMVGIVSGNDLLKIADIRLDQTTSASRSEGSDSDPEWESASILIISEKLLTIPDRPVKEIMTSDVICCFEHTTITEAAKLCASKKIDQLPVIDEEDNLLGMINNYDILQAFVDFSKK